LNICNISGKKDPGIPNRFPFKEEILKEAEKRKQQVSNYKSGTIWDSPGKSWLSLVLLLSRFNKTFLATCIFKILIVVAEKWHLDSGESVIGRYRAGFFVKLTNNSPITSCPN